ncbi:MAG: histidinol-phosphatase HisJ family protein [Bacillota bacterium]
MSSFPGVEGPLPFYDMHVHTHYSPDSDSEMEKLCVRAADLGLLGICFTDHAEFAPGDHVPGAAEMEDMFAEIERLRDTYGDRLTIMRGIEIGYYRGAASDIHSFLDSYEFDFILGSVHVSGDTRYSFPRSFSEGEDPLDYFTPYLEDMRHMIAEIDLDAVGHFDLPKRYGPKYEDVAGFVAQSPLWGRVEEFLAELVDRGLLLEINASGLRQNADALYPCGDVLDLYREMGGEMITLGSDSHEPGNLGWGLRRAARAARRAGFREAVYFLERKATRYSI